LRVLQEKEVHPLGASAPVPVDVRIVAATHRDLDAQVAAGLFRQDLLYRINVVDIRIPPLRERPDDLMPLVAHFLEKHSARCSRPRATVSAGAMEQLRRHSWPGNVRVERVIAPQAWRTATVPSSNLPSRDLSGFAPGGPGRFGTRVIERKNGCLAGIG
jgi:transcriptional regulator with PAS, ATPase and Fis domain